MAITATPKIAGFTYAVSRFTSLVKTATQDVRNAPTTVYSINLEIDTPAGADTIWFKGFDADGANVTAGTTEPEWLLPAINAGSGQSMISNWAIPGGLSMTNGFTFFVSGEDGKDATTEPLDTPECTIVTTS